MCQMLKAFVDMATSPAPDSVVAPALAAAQAECERPSEPERVAASSDLPASGDGHCDGDCGLVCGFDFELQARGPSVKALRPYQNRIVEQLERR